MQPDIFYNTDKLTKKLTEDLPWFIKSYPDGKYTRIYVDEIDSANLKDNITALFIIKFKLK